MYLNYEQTYHVVMHVSDMLEYIINDKSKKGRVKFLSLTRESSISSLQ